MIITKKTKQLITAEGHPFYVESNFDKQGWNFGRVGIEAIFMETSELQIAISLLQSALEESGTLSNTMCKDVPVYCGELPTRSVE